MRQQFLLLLVGYSISGSYSLRLSSLPPVFRVFGRGRRASPQVSSHDGALAPTTPACNVVVFDDAVLEQAAVPLLWEQLQEDQRTPVLNLSARRQQQQQQQEVSLATTTTTTTITTTTKIDDSWSSGQRWSVTAAGLQNMGIIHHHDDNVWTHCPQLLRLDPEQVLATADFLCETFDVSQAATMIQKEPTLLSFLRVDVEYGLDFLGTMMMISERKDVKPVCVMAPELFKGGIEGGLQERAVQSALGDAASATTQAIQTVTGDAAASLKELRRAQQT